jgi:hypothetical protein
MPDIPSDRSPLAFTIVCSGGGRYLIYNASKNTDTADQRPGKWYFRPDHPSPGQEFSDSFDAAEEAESAAWDWDVRVNLGPMRT